MGQTLLHQAYKTRIYRAACNRSICGHKLNSCNIAQNVHTRTRCCGLYNVLRYAAAFEQNGNSSLTGPNIHSYAPAHGLCRRCEVCWCCGTVRSGSTRMGQDEIVRGLLSDLFGSDLDKYQDTTGAIADVTPLCDVACCVLLNYPVLRSTRMWKLLSSFARALRC